MRKTCLQCVYELAKQDPRVIYIGSDVGTGTLEQLKKERPDQFMMEGVSEQHVIGMAAGLAKEGFIPYVNTIATFITRRCFEQIAIDCCLHNLPVRLIGNGGGLVYAPLGPTHQAIEDIAIMRSLPNMTVVAVSDATEMRKFMMTTTEVPGPIYIRLAKGSDPIVSREEEEFCIGKAVLLREPGEVLLVTTGIMAYHALCAADELDRKGIKAGILSMHTIKPLDVEALIYFAPKISMLVTIEEHSRIGGLGSAILEALNDHYQGPLPMIRRLGLPDQFTEEYGSQNSMLESFALQSSGIVKNILNGMSIILEGSNV